MDPRLADAVKLIDERIAALQRLRNEMIQQLDGAIQPDRPIPAASVPSSNSNGSYGTRKDQIAKFIAERGPSTRGEIIAGTGIPAGTIAYCLNDPKRFENKHGKWYSAA